MDDAKIPTALCATEEASFLIQPALFARFCYMHIFSENNESNYHILYRLFLYISLYFLAAEVGEVVRRFEALRL